MTEMLTCSGVEHTDDKDGDAGQVQVHPSHLNEFEDLIKRGGQAFFVGSSPSVHPVIGFECVAVTVGKSVFAFRDPVF